MDWLAFGKDLRRLAAYIILGVAAFLVLIVALAIFALPRWGLLWSTIERVFTNLPDVLVPFAKLAAVAFVAGAVVLLLWHVIRARFGGTAGRT